MFAKNYSARLFKEIIILNSVFMTCFPFVFYPSQSHKMQNSAGGFWNVAYILFVPCQHFWFPPGTQNAATQMF